MSPIRIGSRGSDLALWQANFVREQLLGLGHEVTIEVIKTKGDKIQNLSFDKIEGKGFFTKEIEEKLLDNSIDLAVHSHKDLETSQPNGLMIAAVSDRANPADVLLINRDGYDDKTLHKLKTRATVGTSSARRKVQLLDARPDLNLTDIRGNVPTRIEKLRSGEFDAIVLASAGITRLNLDVSDLHSVELNAKAFIPAPAQGVLALQIRANDSGLKNILSAINNEEVSETVSIERNILKGFNGGCQLPLGAYAEKTEKGFDVWISFAKTVNETPIRAHFFDTDANKLVQKVLKELI